MISCGVVVVAAEVVVVVGVVTSTVVVVDGASGTVEVSTATVVDNVEVDPAVDVGGVLVSAVVDLTVGATTCVGLVLGVVVVQKLFCVVLVELDGAAVLGTRNKEELVAFPAGASSVLRFPKAR